MSSDYEFSDNEADFYDEDDMMDAEEDSASDADMELDADNEDFKVTAKPKVKPYEVPHESFSKEAVEKLMKEDEDHISGIFGVDRDTSALLLRHMQWNKERLIEKYMDNASAVTVAAGITSAEPESELTRGSSRRLFRNTTKQASLKPSSSKNIPRYTSPPPSTQFTCPICLDDSYTLRALALPCSHNFCSNCWSAYIASKVADEQEHTVNCMAEGCNIVSPDSFIITVLTTAKDPAQQADDRITLERFRELVIRHFVGCNTNLKFCPYPSCTNTVSCPAANTKSSLTTIVPIVSCGARGTPVESSLLCKEEAQEVQRAKGKEHIFCFGCPVDSDHRPVVCAVAKMWLKKCADDSETANWIKSNTKECTACNSTIEKNGGCNHMTCKKCKHEFCWVCMGPWSEHGNAWYSCNRYEEKAGVDARDAQSRSRASLERYLHYYNRWANHEQSAKLSVDLYSKTEKKMEEMQVTSALTWIEVQFMKKAVDEVEKCRTTLKWTYAMAYYLAKGNNKDLFEDNQRDLEKAVEDLSELLEQPIEPETIPSLRQKVTDKTVYVQKRNEIVLEDTANGFIENRWKWNVAADGFDDHVPIDL